MTHIHELVRHIFPGAAQPDVERVTEGGSTWVYRIRDNNDVFYLRVLPEADASFAPEVFVHQHLHALGVHVPDVVYFDHSNDLVGHSVMVTTEVAGTAVGCGKDRSVLRKVFFEAGKELAMVNSLPVNGFGWIRRDKRQVDQLQ